jgi:hypothetical protein
MALAKANQLNQWIKRHDSFFIRTLRRLEIHTARMRSKATAPIATPTLRYSEAKGIIADSQPVGAKESTTVVVM